MNSKDKQDKIERIIESFDKNQASALDQLRELGVGLKVLKNNEWQKLSEFELPFKRFAKLYNKVNGVFEITDIGIY